MKKTSITTASLLGALTCNILAQGYFILDNSTLSNRVSIDRPGNPYTGIYGMEVWMANNSDPSLSATLDMTATTNSLAAYAMLAANGFLLEQTFVSETMDGGVLALDVVRMVDVSRPPGTVTVALAAWNSGAGGWAAAAAGNAKGGLIAFVQPTSDYTELPPPAAPPLNWDVSQDLVMQGIPEPAAWALGLAGGTVILMLRRRKMHVKLIHSSRSECQINPPNPVAWRIALPGPHHLACRSHQAVPVRRLANLMKTQALALLLAASSAFAQGFQNLDFESALIDPAQPPGVVSVADALPGWTVYYGSNQVTSVQYNRAGFGGTLVDLLGSSNNVGITSIDGSFSVLLQGGVIGGPGGSLYPAAATISQTGLVPPSARSIRFLAQPEPTGIFSVSLGGVSVPYFALSNGPHYTVFGADISAFAGQTLELDFSLSRTPGTGYSNWNIDDIQFSSMAIPEQSVLALCALGIVVLQFRVLSKTF